MDPRVAGLIPIKAMNLGCRLGAWPQLGECERQLVDVSPHIDVSLSLSPLPSTLRKGNGEISSGEDCQQQKRMSHGCPAWDLVVHTLGRAPNSC